MGIVDNVMSGLRDKSVRDNLAQTNASRHETGPEALALGKPSEYTVDDKIGGTHTRTVHDPIVHEEVLQHAHHEVTPIVNRVREETEIHQKIQPVHHKQEHHTHHQHTAPAVTRHVQEDIHEDHATRYRSQGLHQHKQTIGDQTHSTSVNAPIVRERVNKHIIEEIHPIIQRQTQRIEHHHTSQIINETHIKAPIVHNIIENAAISFEEFAGKLSELTHGKTGSSSGYSTGPTPGLTGSGSGLTDNKTHHTGTTGLTGSGGLTGEKHQEIGSTAPVRAAI